MPTQIPLLPKAAEGAVDLAEQTRVLSKRKGRTIGKRTILKSYVDHTQVDPDPYPDIDMSSIFNGYPHILRPRI